MILQNLLLIGNSKPLAKTLNQLLVSEGTFHLASSPDHSPVSRPDVILIQHEWSCFDGLKHILSAKSLWPKAPIIVLGDAHVSQGEVAESFRLGADDFLFLPIDEETLLTSLSRFEMTKNQVKKTGRFVSFISKFLRLKPFLPLPKLSNGISSMNNSAQPESLPIEKPQVSLQVELLGKLRMIYKGKPVSQLPGKKARSVLAFILVKYPRSVHREVLIDKFWPNSTVESARNCLNVTIHAIRKCFDEISPNQQVVIFSDESYEINPHLSLERDIDLFESYWNKARQIEAQDGMEAAVNVYHQAFAFYRGDLLEEFPYEDWITGQRERWKETWLVILDRLSRHFFKKGKYEISLNLCKKMLQKDQCLEDAHRRLMACYLRIGMKDLALKQFRRCREILEVELCAHPGKATIELFEKIQAA